MRSIGIAIVAATTMVLGLTTGSTMAAAQEHNFWQVGFPVHPTEQGSSGAALLNEDHQVVGTLFGGISACNNLYDESDSTPGGWDLFGKFSVAWEDGLSEHMGGKLYAESDEPVSAPSIKIRKKNKGELPVRSVVSPGLMLKLAADPAHTIVVDAEAIAEAKARFAAESADPSAAKRKMVGTHIDLKPMSAGIWQRLTAKDGTKSWRVAIRAEGAAFLRPHFVGEVAGEALVYDAADAPFGRKVAKPKSAKDDADFWGPIVKGDTLFFEIITDSDTPPAIRIDKISYGVVDMMGGEGGPSSSPEGFTPKAAGACHEDASCESSVDEDELNAVGQMFFSVGSSDFVCTGTLMNDVGTTQTPWFLTANHCISTEASAKSLVVTWEFHTNTCNGTPPDWRFSPFTEGATLIDTGAAGSSSDFTLLRLDSDPADDADVTFMGFTTKSISATEDLLVLHHPQGEYLRASQGIPLGESDPSGTDIEPIGDSDDDDDDAVSVGGDDDDDDAGCGCGA
ncbi:MAG: hypothetical protein H6684_08280 [Deltaproteobacteria bacterium]|nr:hypothetical protein [Deltaproteobacteria bacterium]